VVGPAVRRLVWAVSPEEAADDPGASGVLVFRPLDDGSLTDVDDNEVALPAAGRVGSRRRVVPGSDADRLGRGGAGGPRSFWKANPVHG